MDLGEIREQFNALAGADLTLAEVGAIVNAGLIDLSPALYLQSQFKQFWEAGVPSYPAPDDVLEFFKTGRWEVNGQTRGLNRVEVGSPQPGWWFDGLMIGVQGPEGFAPFSDGIFSLNYYRAPELMTGTDEGQVPDGGPMVGPALVQYCLSHYYDSLGDEVSAELAAKAFRAYQRLHTQIAQSRKRLVTSFPNFLSWRGS